jgi:hypothetical protein
VLTHCSTRGEKRKQNRKGELMEEGRKEGRVTAATVVEAADSATTESRL